MILRTRAADLRVIGRATQGVRLIEMEEGDMVVAVAKLAEREEEAAENGGTAAPLESDSPPESDPGDSGNS
jgi:DNA gyrase subunit A